MVKANNIFLTVLTFFLTVIPWLPTGIEAAEISESAALEKANTFLQSKIHTRGTSDFSLRRTHKENLKKGNGTAYYVFENNENDGFIIVSADDRFPSILGYTQEGNFDKETLPPALTWLLEKYQVEMESYLDSFDSAIDYNGSRSTRTAITPMLTTKWGQDFPYNNDSPKINGYETPAGCVATAIAQILNYHKWPDVGERNHTYRWNFQDLSYDYSAWTPDWNNLLDEYSNQSPEEAQKAVSELMYACGVGLDMNFSPAGSGSGGAAAKRFLVENMKYDNEMRFVSHYNYYPLEWEELIYEELASKCPVFIEGESKQSGRHAFVCDGYDGDGMFHINWGWDGSADGFYLLTSLNPTDATDKYDHDMMALIGCKKREGDYKAMTADLICKGDFTLVGPHAFWIKDIYNYTMKDVNVNYGVKVTNDSTHESQYIGYDYEDSIGALEFAGIFMVTSSQAPVIYINLDNLFKEGSYTITPIIRQVDSEWIELKTLYGNQSSISMEVSADGLCNYGDNFASPDVEITDFDINRGNADFTPGLAYEYDPIDFWITLVNNGDTPYHSGIRFELYDEDEALIFTTKISWLLEAHSSDTPCFDVNLSMEPLSAGNYYVRFYDVANRKMHTDDFKFEVKERPEPDLSNLDYYWAVVDGDNIWYTNLYFEILNNSQEHFQGKIKAVFKSGSEECEYSGSLSLPGLESGYMSLNIASVNYDFKDEDYEIYLYDPSDKIINEIPIIFNKNKIIERENKKVLELNYDLSKTTNPSSAMLLIRTNGDNGFRLNGGQREHIGEDGYCLFLPPAWDKVSIEADYPERVNNIIMQEVGATYLKLYGNISNLTDLDVSFNPFSMKVDLPDNLDLSKINLKADVNETMTLEAGKDGLSVILPSAYREEEGYIIYWMDKSDHLLNEGDDYTYNKEDFNYTFRSGISAVKAVISNGLMKIITPLYALKDNNVDDFIYIESIQLSLTQIEATIGREFTISATIYPENASEKDLNWVIGNEEIVSLIGEGSFKIIGSGNTTITAEALDGSGVSATCNILASAGIESVFDDSKEWDIFSIQGKLIRKGATSEEVNDLDRGIYILVNGKETIKIIKTK